MLCLTFRPKSPRFFIRLLLDHLPVPPGNANTSWVHILEDLWLSRQCQDARSLCVVEGLIPRDIPQVAWMADLELAGVATPAQLRWSLVGFAVAELKFSELLTALDQNAQQVLHFLTTDILFPITGALTVAQQLRLLLADLAHSFARRGMFSQWDLDEPDTLTLLGVPIPREERSLHGAMEHPSIHDWRTRLNIHERTHAPNVCVVFAILFVQVVFVYQQDARDERMKSFQEMSDEEKLALQQPVLSTSQENTAVQVLHQLNTAGQQLAMLIGFAGGFPFFF